MRSAVGGACPWRVNKEASHDKRGNAYSVGFYLPNEQINAKLAYTNIDALFEPALGFVNRNNIEQIVP